MAIVWYFFNLIYFITDGASIKVPITNLCETSKAIAQAIEYMYQTNQHRFKISETSYQLAIT